MKKFFALIILVFLFSPIYTFAAEENQQRKTIRAEVIDVEEDFIRAEDNQGNRYSVGKDSSIKRPGQVHQGDQVILEEIKKVDGSSQYVISSFVRYWPIIILFFLFVLSLLFVNGKRGFRSLINLTVTFCIIVFFIIPMILNGWSPVWISVIGGTVAMLWNIYFSHGINKKAHSAVVGIGLSLLIVGILSTIFIDLASLSGFADEETTIIQAIGYEDINMRGLLLAAILIGALGVLDDLVISQVSVVKELINNKINIDKKELFRSAMRVGHDHTSAIVNTLVLAYTSSAFPLAILLSIGVPPFESFTSALNNEIVATELVRMLTGSIGILLSMPIATIVAVYFFSDKIQKSN